jgi:hypothetical protein
MYPAMAIRRGIDSPPAAPISRALSCPQSLRLLDRPITVEASSRCPGRGHESLYAF